MLLLYYKNGNYKERRKDMTYYGCELGRNPKECPAIGRGCECLDCEEVIDFSAGPRNKRQAALDFKDQLVVYKRENLVSANRE